MGSDSRFRPRMSVEQVEEDLDLAPKFGPDGLLPCTTTDADSGGVLMLGWMNARRAAANARHARGAILERRPPSLVAQRGLERPAATRGGATHRRRPGRRLAAGAAAGRPRELTSGLPQLLLPRRGPRHQRTALRGAPQDLRPEGRLRRRAQPDGALSGAAVGVASSLRSFRIGRSAHAFDDIARPGVEFAALRCGLERPGPSRELQRGRHRLLRVPLSCARRPGAGAALTRSSRADRRPRNLGTRGNVDSGLQCRKSAVRPPRLGERGCPPFVRRHLAARAWLRPQAAARAAKAGARAAARSHTAPITSTAGLPIPAAATSACSRPRVVRKSRAFVRVAS